MKKHIFIILIFIFLAILLTFPLITKINNYCSGFSTTDELLAPVWTYWYWQYSLKHSINFWETDFIAYPFGMKIYGDFFPYTYVGLVALLSTFFNYIAVLNVQILFNFILTGFFTYLLVFKLTKSRIVGLLSGIIFTFSPQHFIRSWQHITLSYFQWMPLYILALFKLKEKPDFKQALFVGLALFLVASFDLHYLFFMFIATLLFTTLVVFYSKDKFLEFAKYLFIGGLISILLVIPQFFIYILKIFSSHSEISSAQNIFKRPFEDLFTQSARPLSYFLPSTEHPVFGGLTKMFIGSCLYGDSLTEHNLYLGIVALCLAFLGWRLLYRKQKAVNKEMGLEKFAFKFFLLLAVASWFFSQPPWWNILSFRLPMPSLLIYKFLPMVRAYCRFGILLMLSIAVLAGFGVRYLLFSFQSQIKKRLVFGAICFLVIFDFWNNPWQHVIDLSRYNKVYDWLKEQKENFVIAEYPLDINGPNDFYKFLQTIHEKKLINGTVPGTYANDVAKTITRLSEPNIAGRLKWLGVRYVLVHTDDYLNTGLIEDRDELSRISANAGIKFIRGFSERILPEGNMIILQEAGPVDVYEVTASPINPGIKEK